VRVCVCVCVCVCLCVCVYVCARHKSKYHGFALGQFCNSLGKGKKKTTIETQMALSTKQSDFRSVRAESGRMKIIRALQRFKSNCCMEASKPKICKSLPRQLPIVPRHLWPRPAQDPALNEMAFIYINPHRLRA